MNITTHSLQSYQVYVRGEEKSLPPIVQERVRALLDDADEFSSPEAVHCWLYRTLSCSLTTFTTSTALKRAESLCVLVPGTRFWQYIHEGELHYALSELPTQDDLWLLTPAHLTPSALSTTPQARGHEEVLIVERFIFTS